MDENDINNKLTNNDALFNKIYTFKSKFKILPQDKEHIGAAISYNDLVELSDEFIRELVDTVVDWVYSSEKYKELVKVIMTKGKTESSANSEVIRKAKQKFRKSDDELLVQGQLGELLLFHFIQRYFYAIPLLRKMKITTSPKHERFGADAIHYKIKDNKNIIILGEAKTYTSKYKFNEAFEKSLSSILNTWANHRDELFLYVHEDFLDKEMNKVAESYLNNTMKNPEIHLVSIIIYNETKKLIKTNQESIHKQIRSIIEKRFEDFNNTCINLNENPILKRITYIAFPVWGLDLLAEKLQTML